MTHAHHALVRAGALAFAAVAALAFAAHAEPEPASVPADPGAAPVLAGPKVPDKTERLTLVQRDSAGKLVRLEDRPEAAAIPLLKLGADAKKAADKVLTDHGVLVARALSEHRALFLQIQGARQSGDMKAAAPLIRELHQKAPDLFEPSLLDKLARALPVEKAAQLRALVTEFFGALAEEMRPEGAPSRRPETRPEKSNGASGGAGQMMQGDGGEGTMMQGGPGMTG
ncbi:MAG: hypothetical protein K2Q09_08850, partial [Phycisphaerales bacterium]|nr:hypothetical protein [Phycisphaerales bacterium]